MSASTWTGACTGCRREGVQVASSRDHHERVLCEACAARPAPAPTAPPGHHWEAGEDGPVLLPDDLEAAPPDGSPPPSSPAHPRIVSARNFLARPRKPLVPLVATPDGRTVLLAAETTLVFAGPSGVGKSLAASFDLAGRLARDVDSDWLGLRVKAGQRVLLLPFEGSDEDNADRVRELIGDDALDRFTVWDRWAGPDLPRADEQGKRALAEEVRRLAIDVLVIDTASAFFGGAVAVEIEAGERAHAALEEMRARSGRRFAVIVPMHTKKADRKGAKVDELEEISGTFPHKADAAVVMRRAGDGESDSHRRIVFAKVRRGPQPRPKLASLSTDPDAPPRLQLLGDSGRPEKAGTEAVAMAEWIAGHEEPVLPALLRAQFDVSDTTLRERRRPQLEALGVRHEKLPGRGNTYAYGTDDQWRRLELGAPAEEPPPPTRRQPAGSTRPPNPPEGVSAGPNSSKYGRLDPPEGSNPPEGSRRVQNPANTGTPNPPEGSPPYGGQPPVGAGGLPEAAHDATKADPDAELAELELKRLARKFPDLAAPSGAGPEAVA